MRHLLIDIGYNTLDIMTEATDSQLNGTFRAICQDTGDKLWIHGELIDAIDELDVLPDTLDV